MLHQRVKSCLGKRAKLQVIHHGVSLTTCACGVAMNERQAPQQNLFQIRASFSKRLKFAA
jgi:hypothetical protein